MDEYRLRLRIFVIFVLIVVGLFGLRLVQLQLIESEVYTGESRKNSIHARVVQPARGLVYDRTGELLVDNVPSYSITLTPRFFNREKTGLLAELLEVSPELVEERLAEARAWTAYRPSRSFREVPFHIFSRVQENLYRLPGVDFEVDEKRRYHGPSMSHALGYITEIGPEQLRRMRADGYRMGDRIGQTGAERTYESRLRGELGRRFVLVNVHGQEVRPYREGDEDRSPVSGFDLHLSIDARLQALTEELMVNKRGAAIALDPRNGEILALVSAPDYDLSRLSGSVDARYWRNLQVDPTRPLFNRATMSGQPPGSTFKPFMALVALQEGVITENRRITCRGAYYFGRPFRCFGGAHGPIDVTDAIKRSCNTFFFTSFMETNFQRWHDWGRKFGFGQLAPLDLTEQSAGVWPDTAYFDRSFGKGRWTRGYLVSLGIGQGNVNLTPMQVARYVAAVANGGYLHTPHMVREFVRTETGDRLKPELPQAERIPIDEEHFKVVQEGMRRMVMENNSTVRWGDVVAAGKTGTSENPHGASHAWFIGYAPYEDPQIAVAVFVENGGFGASVSAPIAGLMMEQYLEGVISQQKQWVYNRAMSRSSAPIQPRTRTTPAGTEAGPADAEPGGAVRSISAEGE